MNPSQIMLLSLSWLVMLSSAARAEKMGILPSAGEPLPEIRLPDLDGKITSTGEMIGKRMVLHLFASW